MDLLPFTSLRVLSKVMPWTAPLVMAAVLLWEPSRTWLVQEAWEAGQQKVERRLERTVDRWFPAAARPAEDGDRSSGPLRPSRAPFDEDDDRLLQRLGAPP